MSPPSSSSFLSVIALILFASLAFLAVDAQIANTTTLPKGWNAAACPTFKSGACTLAQCNQPSVGFLYKFRSFNLKRSTIKQGGKVSEVVSVVGGTASEIGGESIVATTPGQCCLKCAKTAKCVYWQWIPYMKKPCYLLTNNIAKTCDKPIATFGTSSAQKRKQILIGGKCNADGRDDPHFVGARGTRFDFNGKPDRSFCLHTDTSLHINMLMRGYLDNRTQGATVLSSGKAVRTWIRELGILWKSEGVEHKLHLVARRGKTQERGEGFMSAMVLDGKALPRLSVGSRHAAAGGLALTLESLQKSGPYEVEHYRLVISKLIDLDLRMRVASPLLQSPTEAEVHFNVGFNDVQVTDSVHGVLGQTYRADHEGRAADFSALSAELHAPVVADGVSGKGFLDGSSADYVSSSVLSPDCNFSAYRSPESFLSIYS